MWERDLFLFEMPGDQPGAAPVEPAEPVAEEIPAWAQSMQEQVNWMAQQFQEPEPEPRYDYGQQQGPPQDFQAPQIDPFAENFGEQLAGYIGQAVQQSLAPLAEWQYGQQLSEAEERAYDILEDIASREGDFMQKDQAFAAARALANSYMPEEAQRYGWGPQAAEAAIARAAADVRAYETAVREAAIQQYNNQIARLDGAGREPIGAVVASPQGAITQPGGDELSVVTAFGGRVPGRV